MDFPQAPDGSMTDESPAGATKGEDAENSPSVIRQELMAPHSFSL